MDNDNQELINTAFEAVGQSGENRDYIDEMLVEIFINFLRSENISDEGIQGIIEDFASRYNLPLPPRNVASGPENSYSPKRFGVPFSEILGVIAVVKLRDNTTYEEASNTVATMGISNTSEFTGMLSVYGLLQSGNRRRLNRLPEYLENLRLENIDPEFWPVLAAYGESLRGNNSFIEFLNDSLFPYASSLPYSAPLGMNTSNSERGPTLDLFINVLARFRFAGVLVNIKDDRMSDYFELLIRKYTDMGIPPYPMGQYMQYIINEVDRGLNPQTNPDSQFEWRVKQFLAEFADNSETVLEVARLEDRSEVPDDQLELFEKLRDKSTEIMRAYRDLLVATGVEASIDVTPDDQEQMVLAKITNPDALRDNINRLISIQNDMLVFSSGPGSPPTGADIDYVLDVWTDVLLQPPYITYLRNMVFRDEEVGKEELLDHFTNLLINNSEHSGSYRKSANYIAGFDIPVTLWNIMMNTLTGVEQDEETDEETDEEYDEEYDDSTDEEYDEEYDDSTDEETDEEYDEEYDDSTDEETDEEIDDRYIQLTNTDLWGNDIRCGGEKNELLDECYNNDDCLAVTTLPDRGGGERGHCMKSKTRQNYFMSPGVNETLYLKKDIESLGLTTDQVSEIRSNTQSMMSAAADDTGSANAGGQEEEMSSIENNYLSFNNSDLWGNDIKCGGEKYSLLNECYNNSDCLAVTTIPDARFGGGERGHCMKRKKRRSYTIRTGEPGRPVNETLYIKKDLESLGLTDEQIRDLGMEQGGPQYRYAAEGRVCLEDPDGDACVAYCDTVSRNDPRCRA